MANYCGKCGSKLIKKLGLCPKCNRAKIVVCSIFAGLLILSIFLLGVSNRRHSIENGTSVPAVKTTETIPAEIRRQSEENTIPYDFNDSKETITVADFAPDAWKDNILMSNSLEWFAPMGNFTSSIFSEFVMGSDVQRADIISVVFESTTAEAAEDHWDVSDKQDGSVLAWTILKEKNDYGRKFYELHIAANGGINGKLACKDLFCGYDSLETIDFGGCFHTEETKDMSRMFYSCTNLKYLDLSGFRTACVETTSEMFADCASLTSLDISPFDTSNVTNMSGMFRGCMNLTKLDMTGIHTGNVKDMMAMFLACPAGTMLDLNHFDTSSVQRYGLFMYEDELIQGHPWKEIFPPVEETNIGENRTLEKSWDTGHIQIHILAFDHIRIELEESLLETKAFQNGEENLLIFLRHDPDFWTGYEICFGYRDDEMFSYCYYPVSGSASSGTEPEEYIWTYENGIATIDIWANDLVQGNMYELITAEIYCADEKIVVSMT